MRQNNYGYQTHSTFAYYCWAKSLLAFCWELGSHWFPNIGGCYGVYLLLSDSNGVAMFTSWGSTIWVCTTITLWSIPIASICATDAGLWPTPGVHWWLLTSFLCTGGASCYLVSCLGTWQSHLIPQHPNMTGGSLLFKGLHHPVTQSTLNLVGVKPGDSRMVIEHQDDEFTHTWLVECFVAWSHIYPWFRSKVSTVAHFWLEPGCDDHFWTDQLKTLNMVLIPSSLTPSKHQNRMHLLISLKSWLLQSPQGYLARLVPFLIILNCSLLLVSNLLSYGAISGHFLPVALAGKIVASKLIHYFPVIHQHTSCGLLHYWITSFWILQIIRLIRVFLIFRLAYCGYSCHIWYRTAYFKYQNCTCWYHYLSVGSHWGIIPSFQKCMNYQDSWHSAQLL